MKAPPDTSIDTSDRHEPLTTKEGWRRFVNQPPDDITTDITIDITANTDTDGESDSLDAASTSREEIDRTRLAYHSRLAVVATPTIRQVTLNGRRLIVLNRHQLSARRGLIVTGPAATGKTTAITQLGKAHELALQLRHPHAGPRMPVLYATVPPAATPRMLAVEFARFLGLPVTSRANITDVTNTVCAVLIELRCDLIIIDELHNLNLATRSGAEVSDQLKYFSERLPATFIYAGIDLARTGLFTGTRGRQIASRFATIPTTPFSYATTAHRDQWHALVASLEATLRLRHHPPGALLRSAAYLHARTGGMIGSLSHLIRAAAIDAIITGTEKITKTSLDEVHLDHAAHTHHTTTALAGPPPRTRHNLPRNTRRNTA